MAYFKAGSALRFESGFRMTTDFKFMFLSDAVEK